MISRASNILMYVVNLQEKVSCSVLKVNLTVEHCFLVMNKLFLKKYDLGNTALYENKLSLFRLTFR